jgi:hypothetical protein
MSANMQKYRFLSSYPTSTTSLVQYLDTKVNLVPGAKTYKMRDNKYLSNVTNELLNFGLTTLQELDALLNNEDFIRAVQKYYGEDSDASDVGLLRDVMMFNDIDKYFEAAWHKNWAGLDSDGYDFLKKTDKTPEREIKTAEKRMKDFIKQYGGKP